MADTPTGETVNPGDSQTTVTTPAAPVANASDPAEVERLRKEKEQADLRIRQLENEKKAREEKEEADRRKQQEENDEWKTIAEQEKTKREALERETEAEKRSAELKTATSELFSAFPSEVVEIAEEAGLGLSDVTEEAKAALKAKLDNIKAKVVTDRKVTPNNPNNPSGATAETPELLARMRNGDKQARTELVSRIPGVQAMRKQAGLSE